MADSSSEDIDFMDVVWLRRNEYNHIDIKFEAMYDSRAFGKPSYVGESQLGVVAGYADVVQVKIPRPGKLQEKSNKNVKMKKCSRILYVLCYRSKITHITQDAAGRRFVLCVAADCNIMY